MSAAGREVQLELAVKDESQDLLPGGGAGSSGGGARGALASSRDTSRRRLRAALALLFALSVLALSLAAGALGVAGRAGAAARSRVAAGDTAGWPEVRRIAFGSCTSYDARPQDIWTQAVIPAAPDAWVWLGDFAYLDEPVVDCRLLGANASECACEASFMRSPPSNCAAGDVAYARMRFAMQLAMPQYQAFLAFMCPAAAAAQRFPPPGSDPAACRRPVLGVSDDHDAGYNNANKRNPVKLEVKQAYLDALGEPQDSPRRSAATGLQAAYTLPGPGTRRAGSVSGSSGAGSDSSEAGSGSSRRAQLADEVRLILLDGRWERDTLPCSKRSAWCRDIVLADPAASSPGDIAWCRDFVGDAATGQRASCCTKDDEWGAWCAQPGSWAHPLWPQLCDPTDARFGLAPAILAADNSSVLPSSERLWESAAAPRLWPRLLEGRESPLCEVLGARQRRWLRQELASSRAALNVIASGSVLAGNEGWVDTDGSGNTCSGDDWACWRRAQVNLLHTIANASAAGGCSVVITGDFHFSDLKVVRPGNGSAYAGQLQTQRLAKPVFQVMSSGLTWSTAKHANEACDGTFREDTAGLRPLGRCAFVAEPSFGLLEVDWASRQVTLSLRNHTTAGVARGVDGSEQALTVNLDDCSLVEAPH